MQAVSSWEGPVLDNHFHLNRNGRYLEAAHDFKKAGGTDIVLVHCPNFSSPPTSKAGHTETYADTVAMAEEVRKSVGLGVRVVLGPHPAAFAHQFAAWLAESGEQGAERAMENYRDSIDAALEFVREGKAHAIGEVGRPHWQVDDLVWDLSNTLLLETMTMAKKEGIALQLHVEGELESTYRDMSMMAQKVGLEPRKLVRHYAPSIVSHEVTQGLTPSVLIGKGALEDLVRTAEACSHGFFLETDYMDDLRRPGAVLGPKTVPKRTNQLLEAGLDEEYLWKAHRDLAEELYGPSIR
ncbi:MAG: TatD family hydrolase [Candidatus Poseidoniaceae archaeon]|nr:TatD family hydrolase [Candidatus Poseidoniaceae archaeon]